MLNGRPMGWQLQRLLAVQTGMKDRLHTFIRTGIKRESAASRGFQPVGPIQFAETQDAQATAEALLGVRTGLKDLIDECGDRWTDG